LALRKLNWNGYGYYEKYKTRQDYLYLIILFFRDQKIIKIGRSFFSLKKRYVQYDYRVLKIWSSSHKNIYELEQKCLVAFQNYIKFGPTYFLGRTECFDENSPIETFIDFIDTEFLNMTISSQACSTELEGSETTGEVQSS